MAHLIWITGNDHNDALAIVFHEFQKRIDCLTAEVPTGASLGDKCIGFVDKQNSVKSVLAFVEGPIKAMLVYRKITAFEALAS